MIFYNSTWLLLITGLIGDGCVSPHAWKIEYFHTHIMVGNKIWCVIITVVGVWIQWEKPNCKNYELITKKNQHFSVRDLLWWLYFVRNLYKKIKIEIRLNSTFGIFSSIQTRKTIWLFPLFFVFFSRVFSQTLFVSGTTDD